MTATPNHTPGIPTQAGATTPALTVENLTITSSDGSLVDDVSFTLHPGECVAFIGESGAGKSLTAKALIGLLPTPLQAHGTITLGDTVLSNPTPAPQRTWRTVRGRASATSLKTLSCHWTRCAHYARKCPRPQPSTPPPTHPSRAGHHCHRRPHRCCIPHPHPLPHGAQPRTIRRNETASPHRLRAVRNP